LTILPLWSLAIVLLVFPTYLCYMNELFGGPSDGYQYLLDSNYDWGQDAVQLKQYCEEHHLGRIYLNYYGTQAAIEYYRIPNTRVSAEQARQLRDGWLVVSASELMRPDWDWLRESRRPTARIAYTLFVYQMSALATPR